VLLGHLDGAPAQHVRRGAHRHAKRYRLHKPTAASPGASAAAARSSRRSDRPPVPPRTAPVPLAVPAKSSHFSLLKWINGTAVRRTCGYPYTRARTHESIYALAVPLYRMALRCPWHRHFWPVRWGGTGAVRAGTRPSLARPCSLERRVVQAIDSRRNAHTDVRLFNENPTAMPAGLGERVERRACRKTNPKLSQPSQVFLPRFQKSSRQLSCSSAPAPSVKGIC